MHQIPVTLQCDSIAVIGHMKNVRYHAKTKHIDEKFNFIRSRLEEVTFKYIPMERLVANPQTNPLDSTLFLSHVRDLGLRNW